MPSAFLPDSKSNHIFVISGTQLDFEIKLGEFKGVDNLFERNEPEEPSSNRPRNLI